MGTNECGSAFLLPATNRRLRSVCIGNSKCLKHWIGEVNYCQCSSISVGERTTAFSCSCGKSFGFNVTRKSALPFSAQRQKGSSFGSGEIPSAPRDSTSSALSRTRLTIFPISAGRTFSRLRTSLYSSRISSVISQTKLPLSAHSRSKSALGTRPRTYSSLKPETPAANTLVSTTPRLFFLVFRGNSDLRRSSFLTVRTDRAQDFFFRDLA